MRFWKLVSVKGNVVPIPESPLYCMFCGEPMLLHSFSANRHVDGWHHLDISVKCPNCSWHVVFGVPISEEEYEEVKKSKYHMKVLRGELVKELKQILKYYRVRDDKIPSRLRNWGYW